MISSRTAVESKSNRSCNHRITIAYFRRLGHIPVGRPKKHLSRLLLRDFYSRMLFLSPDQQCQSTKANTNDHIIIIVYLLSMFGTESKGLTPTRHGGCDLVIQSEPTKVHDQLSMTRKSNCNSATIEIKQETRPSQRVRSSAQGDPELRDGRNVTAIPIVSK